MKVVFKKSLPQKYYHHISAFYADDKNSKNSCLKEAQKNPRFKQFKSEYGSQFSFDASNAFHTLICLGSSKDITLEKMRRAVGNAIKTVLATSQSTLAISLDSFCDGVKIDFEQIAQAIHESVGMSLYEFNEYKSQKITPSLKEIILHSSSKSYNTKNIANVIDSITIARNLINKAPNELNSETYSKFVQADTKKNLKGVTCKVLGKAQLKKEKMNLFLSVNAGSGYEPQLVHLTYTPTKKTKNMKHIALVGKGLTFDTGGYSLKPSASMMGMKFDMGGSATVYGAFRAAVLNKSPHKITCILGLTDNAVSSYATFPDSIVTSRKGVTVEILNTDAEGRLVLADCLDYASDQKPDEIIDAATLTGAALVALGNQVCALLGNDQKFADHLLAHAREQGEHLWQLPLVDEYRDDIKSHIADIKNIGSAGKAGTATAAAFLEKFIGDKIKWAHFDIAGVCDSQSHLSYCPSKGASGLMIRTMAKHLMHS